MNITKSVTLLTLALGLAFAGEGCRHHPQKVTPLPGQATQPPEGTGPKPGDGLVTAPPTGVNPAGVDPKIFDPHGGVAGSHIDTTGWPQNREIFKAYTVYFDFDRSVVRSSEASKVEAVATQFKSGDPATVLLVEGHCDERGTPEYNRALGERRALAIREGLVRAGVNPEHVQTISFGKEKPAIDGHNESAWSKNRRGEFILLTPPK